MVSVQTFQSLLKSLVNFAIENVKSIQNQVACYSFIQNYKSV